ncbi:MAG: hypothetical protein JSS91_05720 [Bacteroidetes bacterium]|nr:hypothetical protein [Bacteroidota bacterium]
MQTFWNNKNGTLNLVNKFQQRGRYSGALNGSNLASRVYFYKLDATGKDGINFLITKRMIPGK